LGSDNDFPLSLLMLDLDHFKQVNDTHGHEAGDQVLLWLSSLMRDVSSDDHFPIRYGGDEFMILVPGAGADEGGCWQTCCSSGSRLARSNCAASPRHCRLR
jgi:diguanylate cyclase (GGDEF)-like protein